MMSVEQTTPEAVEAVDYSADRLIVQDLIAQLGERARGKKKD